ncbi:protein DpdJ [Duganella fentianensis]|uniref:protein DpdJ n=1 Tax=Duganella fentianensis TaxID=2692177 RepID=UPI0032B114E2
MDQGEQLLLRVLDQIEQGEARLLTWGIVDGVLAQSEINALIEPILDEAIDNGFDAFLDPYEVIEVMLRRCWVAQVEREDGSIAYRSRMAETVRLLQRLRQLFPKHAGPSAWQQAPTLVADFRFLRRRREYPRRDLAAHQALQELREVTSNEAVLTAAEALLIPFGKPLTLSGFQLRAALRILGAIEQDLALSTIVCAGTGSGKTLAFYLPALASIARHLMMAASDGPWVKAVALYPRTELLKDQLRDVLMRSIALAQVLPPAARVNIRVGALYGDIPSSARFCDWPMRGGDCVCPVVSCLKCSGELRWLEADRSTGRERLICANCTYELDGEIFPLTRQAIKKRPPDLLFTTTEMLNQRMADNSMAHLFGIGPSAIRPPELVLMDEVHTYDGRHGAQVAYLMRRWQRMLNCELRFVGLSATLREASEFFATLTGSRHKLVEEISPRPTEIESEGAEYLIALRGDPVSRTALLSTTIQTTMLLQRSLDPLVTTRNSVSHGAFGRKTFVFTDNLDVINRLYFDLLSAEGRNSSGAPDTRSAPNGGLALLRARGNSQLRYANGQDWRFAEAIRPDSLRERLSIKRVSSQDRGVDPEAEVVVATAVLEVGFDDPWVGAVVQHKAPRGMASFLQRKGRAGRTRGMRPWTTVVLSDYGRDRAAYQSYDLLFDPELPVRTLPLSNRHLTRMQAVYATLDYLGGRLQDAPVGSVWTDLSGPVTDKLRRKHLLQELRNILESENATARLTHYLQQALRLKAEDITSLLWEFPRPLMTMVLPTALRRIDSNWQAHGETNMDYAIANNPLPEFVPGNLFADLSLAEVEIRLTGTHANNLRDRRVMSVFSALREFAPGRVSRRYGIRHRGERHWLLPAPEMQTAANIVSGATYLEINRIGSHVSIGQFQIHDGEKVCTLPVWRPVALLPTEPPSSVKDSSNASLHWHSQFVACAEPVWLRPPEGGVWRDLVERLGFFTHARHAPLEVRRFAVGASAEIGVGQERIRVDTEFSMDGARTGLGASFLADAVLIQLRVPDRLWTRDGDGTETKWRALRTTRFLDTAWRGHSLAMVPSPFMREWLAQIFLSAVTFDAIDGNVGLEAAAQRLITGTASISLLDVLRFLFHSNLVEAHGDEAEDVPQDRLREDLEVCLQRGDVLDELLRMAIVLWEEVNEEWEPWLRGVYRATCASALLRSITDLCPTIDADDLHVDLGRGPIDSACAVGVHNGCEEVWISERGPGGSGLIEEFMRRYAEDPRRFFSIVRANLQMGEFELIDHQLQSLVDCLANNTDSALSEQVRAFRGARSQRELSGRIRQIRVEMVKAGFAPFHGFLASMGNRVIRYGSGPASDQYLSNALKRWNALEATLGIEIDLRVMSYFLSQSSDIDRVIPELSAAVSGDRRVWRMSTVYGLLWARGRAVRQSGLEVRNPFCELPPVERLLVADVLVDDRLRVSVLDADWLSIAAEQLARGQLVTLVCPETRRDCLGLALNVLITNPIDAGYIRAYARLQGVRQNGGHIEADIELIEATQ